MVITVKYVFILIRLDAFQRLLHFIQYTIGVSSICGKEGNLLNWNYHMDIFDCVILSLSDI